MATQTEFHELIERLIDYDRPLAEGELQKYRRNLEQQFVTARRRLRTAVLVILCGIPVMIVAQFVILEASRVGTSLPAIFGWLAYAVALVGIIVVPLAVLWLLLFYLPRYLRTRWDLRDSVLALLVARVDELTQRLDEMKVKT